MTSDMQQLAGLAHSLAHGLICDQDAATGVLEVVNRYLFQVPAIGEVEILPMQHAIRVNDTVYSLEWRKFLFAVALMQRPGEILTQEQLKAAVNSNAARSSNWAAVMNSNVSRELGVLGICFEKAMEEDDSRVRKRGYRFNPDLAQLAEPFFFHKGESDDC